MMSVVSSAILGICLPVEPSAFLLEFLNFECCKELNGLVFAI